MIDGANVIRLDPEIQRHVRARIARLPAVVHALHDEGQKILTEGLITYFDSIDDALFEMADVAGTNQEQNIFFDSMREVRVQRQGMETRFFDSIEEAFARLVGGDSRDAFKASGELSSEALSLVQNEDLEQLVALEETVDHASIQLAEEMQGLNNALSRLVSAEITGVQNPFGPNVIAMAAMAQFKRLDIDVKAKLVLFRLFDELIIQQLPDLYQQLYGVLSVHGIDIGVVMRSSQAQAFEVDYEASNEPEVQVDELEVAAKRKQLIELLSFIQKLPESASDAYGVDVGRVLVSVQKRRGQDLVLSRMEEETISLVQMLFQFIIDNESLDDRMKKLFARMQIPVLKVALLDETFLTKNRHPARLLINELASAALQWQGGTNPSDSMFVFMKRTVDRIAYHVETNVDIFKDSLADFTAFIEKETRRAAVLEKRTVDAEAGKAKAEQARNTVASEVSERITGYSLPDAILELINGPWSNVLFVTGLKCGFSSVEWAEQLKVLSDLVWSVQPCNDKGSRQQLIGLIPDLLSRLRQGLDSVSYNPFEVSELFKSLEEIHLVRMRGELLPSEEPSVSEESAQGQTPLDQEAQLDKGAQSDAAQTQSFDADDALGEIESLMSTSADVLSGSEMFTDDEDTGDQEEQASSELSESDPHMVAVAAFSQGAWFNFDGDLRCRLAAFIKPTGRYIFVNRSGAKVAEKTRQELARALKDGSLCPLDSSMVFDKALESVVAGLRKSSSMQGQHKKD